MSLLYLERNEVAGCCSYELHVKGGKCNCNTRAFSYLSLFCNEMEASGMRVLVWLTIITFSSFWRFI
jgi:hypothetical protein